MLMICLDFQPESVDDDEGIHEILPYRGSAQSITVSQHSRWKLLLKRNHSKWTEKA